MLSLIFTVHNNKKYIQNVYMDNGNLYSDQYLIVIKNRLDKMKTLYYRFAKMLQTQSN